MPVIFIISETLRARVSDAVFKKRDRPRLDQSTNIFLSIPTRPPRDNGGDSMEHNDGGDNLDEVGDNNQGSASPSVRQIVRQRQRRMMAMSNGDKEGQKMQYTFVKRSYLIRRPIAML